MPESNEQEEREFWERFKSQLDPHIQERQQRIFSQAKGEAPAWYLVEFVDLNPEPQCRRFGTFEELAAAIRQLKPQDWACPFYGWPVRYSEATDGSGFRYLFHPSGQAFPLFETPREVRPSGSFFIQGFSPEEDEEEGDEEDSELDEPQLSGDGSTGVDEEIPSSEDLDDVPDAEDDRDEFPGM